MERETKLCSDFDLDYDFIEYNVVDLLPNTDDFKKENEGRIPGSAFVKINEGDFSEVWFSIYCVPYLNQRYTRYL